MGMVGIYHSPKAEHRENSAFNHACNRRSLDKKACNLLPSNNFPRQCALQCPHKGHCAGGSTAAAAGGAVVCENGVRSCEPS